MRSGLTALAAALALITGCSAAEDDSSGAAPRDAVSSASEPRDIGVTTSLPIFWRESAGVTDLLQDEQPPHWALNRLREFGVVRPLDSLVPEGGGSLPLSSDGWLVLAQPYPFSPQENVALDDWVRGGGRVLLFADPMLTQESAYTLGDRRRPQDVILMSPILARWGLELLFDEEQKSGYRAVTLDDGQLPVNLSGSFTEVGETGKCGFEADGLIATCQVGKGRVVAVADAALLEDVSEESAPRSAVLHALLKRLGA